MATRDITGWLAPAQTLAPAARTGRVWTCAGMRAQRC